MLSSFEPFILFWHLYFNCIFLFFMNLVDDLSNIFLDLCSNSSNSYSFSKACYILSTTCFKWSFILSIVRFSLLHCFYIATLFLCLWILLALYVPLLYREKLPQEIMGILVTTRNASRTKEDAIVCKFWILNVKSSTPP